MIRAGKPLFYFFGLCFILLFNTSFATSIEGIRVYHRNCHLHPEHMQKLAEDISRYRNADNIWDVLRDEFSLAHYDNHPAVREKIWWFMNNQEYLVRSAARAAPYLYYILQEVRKRHLPAEIVLLPIIESGYNPFSLSSAGASGIWQLMPLTATGLGIKQDVGYDGRRDVIASTRGALNHLAYLQRFFDGNWLLALAAYNTGEGNVLFAIKRNIRYGYRTDFWSLPVAQQTRDYVPSLLALAVIISHPERYPVYFPPVRNAPYLAQVDVGKQMNLKYAASLAGISYRKLIQLNPGFNQPRTRRGLYKLVLPIENVEQFSENLASSPLNNQIQWQHYKVKAGDSLASIAKKHKISVIALQKFNHLSKTTIRRGMNLLIPNRPDETGFVAKNKNKLKAIFVAKSDSRLKEVVTHFNQLGKYQLQPGDTIYMVRKKETLSHIAKNFHMSTQTLMLANQLSSKKIMEGKRLIIPTHPLKNDRVYVANRLMPGDTIYMVRKGDTLEKIATRFQTTPAAIRLTNLLEHNGLHEGEKLVVPTHLRT